MGLGIGMEGSRRWLASLALSALVFGVGGPAFAQRAPRGRTDPMSLIDRGPESAETGQTGDSSQSEGAAKGPRVDVLPEACEVGLALSAAPENLRPAVGLLILREEGYRRVRASTNGFDCIVNRDHPMAIKPTCFDAEGAATIVPKIVQVGDWLLEGLDTTEIERRVAEGFESGLFRAPARPGVAYMLSNFNRPWNPNTETLGWFPPHIMFYAPELTNRDIGFDPASYEPGQMLPLIAYEGPHGFMVMVTGETRPRAKGELKRCPDWVVE